MNLKKKLKNYEARNHNDNNGYSYDFATKRQPENFLIHVW